MNALLLLRLLVNFVRGDRRAWYVLIALALASLVGSLWLSARRADHRAATAEGALRTLTLADSILRAKAIADSTARAAAEARLRADSSAAAVQITAYRARLAAWQAAAHVRVDTLRDTTLVPVPAGLLTAGVGVTNACSEVLPDCATVQATLRAERDDWKGRALTDSAAVVEARRLVPTRSQRLWHDGKVVTVTAAAVYLLAHLHLLP